MVDSVEGISGYGKMYNCHFQKAKFVCGRREVKKETGGRENPSEIERYVSQQSKSARFINTERGQKGLSKDERK